MRMSERGIALIKQFEGRRLGAYRDIAGVWTIGYGHTGEDVRPGDLITPERAEELLRVDLMRFERGVRERVSVPLNQHQFDALVSLAFNIGLDAFGRSTVRKRLNRHDYKGAADAFLMWKLADLDRDGKTEPHEIAPGLKRRREAERALFLEPVPEPKP